MVPMTICLSLTETRIYGSVSTELSDRSPSQSRQSSIQNNPGEQIVVHRSDPAMMSRSDLMHSNANGFLHIFAVITAYTAKGVA
jgi:hypothetical protein